MRAAIRLARGAFAGAVEDANAAIVVAGREDVHPVDEQLALGLYGRALLAEGDHAGAVAAATRARTLQRRRPLTAAASADLALLHLELYGHRAKRLYSDVSGRLPASR